MTTLTDLQPAPVIDETARLLTEHYVFPETAEQLAGLLRRRLAEGEAPSRSGSLPGPGTGAGPPRPRDRKPRGVAQGVKSNR